MSFSQEIVESVIVFIAEQHGDSKEQWQLARPVKEVSRPRAHLVFISLLGPDTTLDLAVKIKRDSSQTGEISEDFKIRGRLEYEGMLRLFNHYELQDDPNLTALRPWAYFPKTNAFVMQRIEGGSLHDYSMTVPIFLNPGKRKQAISLGERAGQWLRSLHTIEQNDVVAEYERMPADVLAILRDEVKALDSFGIDTSLLNLESISKVCNAINLDESVWIHSDYHMGNIYVSPQQQILCIDTRLNRRDSPYYDLGNFIAEVKTHKISVLSLGLFPPKRWVERINEALLRGYFGDSRQAKKELLGLYEGYFLLRKWKTTLRKLAQSRLKRIPLLYFIVEQFVINRFYIRLINKWLRTIDSATG